MSAAIYDALLVCDEAHYTRDKESLAAHAALRDVVAADPDEARAMLGRLTGCRRTVARHSSFLRAALNSL